MKTFHIANDEVRLYFRNVERVPDREEFENIMRILIDAGVEILDRVGGPDCDIIRCKIENRLFNAVRSLDGDGSFLYVEDKNTMRFLESLFEMD